MQFYRQDWAGTNPSSPAVAKRGLPAPIDSPPFPSSDWIYGGAPDLGAPDGNTYPLMSALGLENSRTKVYGWVAASIDFSTSGHNNFPVSYDIFPNKVQLNQAVIYIERLPDTVQNDHFDWGYHVTGFYGIDYRFTTAKGWLSDQLLEHNDLYGYDPVELYAQLYVPYVLDGLILTAGRYISPPDIEAQLAPDNYLFTHSLMFTYDPYTFTGANAQLQLSKQWVVQVGFHAGSDMAPWANSAQPNGEFLVRFTTEANNDSFWGGLDSIGAGQFKDEHDDLQVAIATWGHRFNARLHMMTEGYYLWEQNAVVGGTCIDGPTQPYAAGGGCGAPLPGRSSAIGAVNFFMIKLRHNEYIAIRNDFLDDPRGWRTGFPTWYTSHTVGWVYELNDLFMIRPEIRYERSYADGITAYDDGTKKNQFTASADALLRF